MKLDRATKITFGLALLLAALALLLLGYVLPAMVASDLKDAHAANDRTTLVAQQFDASSCVLAAIATHLNYRLNSTQYSARSLAQAYTARYGTRDWYLNGDTSHAAQELVRYTIEQYTPVYAHLTDDASDPVGRMKALAYYKKYPVIFLDGSPQHAIVLVAANNDSILVADPLDGSLHNENAYTLYAKLEPQKWVFYTQ